MVEWREEKDFIISGKQATYKVWIFRLYKEVWNSVYSVYKPTDTFKLKTIPICESARTRSGDAGYVTSSFVSEHFDKNMANRVYLSLEHGMSYEQLVNALIKNNLMSSLNGIGYKKDK